ESDAGVLQSDSHPAAGWQSRVLPPASAGNGAALPSVLPSRIPADHGAELFRAERPGRVPVAGSAAHDARNGCGRLARAAEREHYVTLPPSVTAHTPGGGFSVELEQFSGPLDLLLHLIREDEVDITDLPIARIADQFLAAINDLGLNQAADYLEMAARLL